MKKTAIALALSALLVTGCGSMTKEEQGAMWGAIGGIALGALVGDAVDCKGCAAIGGAIGGIGGGTLGASVGRNLDRLDRQQINHALEHRRSGQSTMWSNPDSGARHHVVVKPATMEQGTYCREWTDTVTVAGEQQQLYGKACRQPDGNWKLVQ